MILTFDTYYYDNKAKTICLAFQDWPDSEASQVYSEITDIMSDYLPGEFYKRELPCIMSLLKKIGLDGIDTIIVDGFVFLDDENKYGLGGHLYNEVNETIPVIGVAKTNFATIEKNKRVLLRGESIKPLYITSVGIDLEEATSNIKSMHGTHRMPTLLKEMDRLTKAI